MKRLKEVCELAGVSKRTLQYYDDEGLLPAERSETNERLYSEEALSRLWKILIYKEMGFRLVEIKELISLTDREYMTKLNAQQISILDKTEELEFQIELINYVKTHGIPDIDKKVERGLTYMDCLDEIKDWLKVQNNIRASQYGTHQIAKQLSFV